MGTTKEAIESLQKVNEQLKGSMDILSLRDEIPRIYQEIKNLQDRISVLENGKKSPSKGKSNSKKSNGTLPVKKSIKKKKK